MGNLQWDETVVDEEDSTTELWVNSGLGLGHALREALFGTVALRNMPYTMPQNRDSCTAQAHHAGCNSDVLDT